MYMNVYSISHPRRHSIVRFALDRAKILVTDPSPTPIFPELVGLITVNHVGPHRSSIRSVTRLRNNFTYRVTGAAFCICAAQLVAWFVPSWLRAKAAASTSSFQPETVDPSPEKHGRARWVYKIECRFQDRPSVCSVKNAGPFPGLSVWVPTG